MIRLLKREFSSDRPYVSKVCGQCAPNRKTGARWRLLKISPSITRSTNIRLSAREFQLRDRRFVLAVSSLGRHVFALTANNFSKNSRIDIAAAENNPDALALKVELA